MSRTFTCDICGTHRWDTEDNCPICTKELIFKGKKITELTRRELLEVVIRLYESELPQRYESELPQRKVAESEKIKRLESENEILLKAFKNK